MRKSKKLQFERMRRVANGVDCRGCGRCCRMYQYVPLLEDEIPVLHSLNARVEDNKLIIKDGCKFDTGNGCGIYLHRPSGCRSYPFVLTSGCGPFPYIGIKADCLLAERFSGELGLDEIPHRAIRGTQFWGSLQEFRRQMKNKGTMHGDIITDFGGASVIVGSRQQDKGCYEKIKKASD